MKRALLANTDVLGNVLLRSAAGPTYAGVEGLLKPLMLAGGPKGTALTDSGVYYLAFGQPFGVPGAGQVALHVADGGQIISQHVGGPSLTIGVGQAGNERYGTCLARLATPRLAAGYFPILETAYVDAADVHYQQESFAARIPETRSLVSFVRLTVDATRSTLPASRVRFTPSLTNVSQSGDRLVNTKNTSLLFSAGGTFERSSVVYSERPGRIHTIYVAWIDRPSPTRPLTLNRASYAQARRSLISYWQRRLSQGTTFLVPEKRVLDAERNLLIQNLGMTWRYSLGNAYQEFEFPESLDNAEVMSEYGFPEIARSILVTSFSKKPSPYRDWEMGSKLLSSALYYQLSADQSYIAKATLALSRYVEILSDQLAASKQSILPKARYASDLPDIVYGLNSQSVIWQGLRSIAAAWDLTGHRALAQQAQSLATKLGNGLRAALRVSVRKLPDGSLFVPAKLLDSEQPYGALTASTSGSYWNLVIPYALASGLLHPGSAEARGVLRYMLTHGSRLLGLVRGGTYALYKNSGNPGSGSDQVYGLDVSRFLADNNQPKQLILSLYGQLAAAMTQGTFVSGEGATITPIPGEHYRKMYLPPNSVSNSTFLETLRLMLIHETKDRNGNPQGLELAYSIPRAWLLPGRRIVATRAPTSFGPISFSISSSQASVHITLSVPARARLRTLKLRIRLPRKDRITGVTLNGRPFHQVNPGTETLNLSRQVGNLNLLVHYKSR